MNALDISYTILKKADVENVEMSNIKLNTLLYFTQALYLNRFDKPLFSDSLVAWRF